MIKQVTGLELVHHFERRAMEYRRLSFALAATVDLGKMDPNSRHIVRSTAIALRHDATSDETLLANLKLWLITKPDVAVAELAEGAFIDLQGYRTRRASD